MNTTLNYGDPRAAMLDHIRGRGTFQTRAVEQAFTAVDRAAFLPGNSADEAYALRAVVTKRTDDGEALSSASSPNLVAQMLEQLAARLETGS